MTDPDLEQRQPDQKHDAPPSLPRDRSLAEVFGLGTAIFSYTRAQALEDGVLVDVSTLAQEVGFRFPVAVTSALWADISTIPEGSGQDVTGRLWDVLYMGALAIRRAVAADGDTDTVKYGVILSMPGDVPGEEQPYMVKSVVGPGDDLEPVITLMKPHED